MPLPPAGPFTSTTGGHRIRAGAGGVLSSGSALACVAFSGTFDLFGVDPVPIPSLSDFLSDVQPSTPGFFRFLAFVSSSVTSNLILLNVNELDPETGNLVRATTVGNMTINPRALTWGKGAALLKSSVAISPTWQLDLVNNSPSDTTMTCRVWMGGA